MANFMDYNPVFAFIYFVSALGIIMFVNNPIITIIFLFSGIIFNIQLTGKRSFFSSISLYITMLVIITVTNPIFVHNGATPLFFLNSNPVTLEALAYGLELSLMLVAVIIWFNCFNIIITSEKVIFIFGNIIPRISLILTMVLRYVPLLKMQFRNIKNARLTMGLFHDGSKVDYIKSSLSVLSVALSISFENAIETANSMNARGYAAKLEVDSVTKKKKRKTNYAIYKVKKHDIIFICIVILCDFVLLVELATGGLVFNFYPTLSQFNLDFNLFLAIIAIAILAFLPICVNLCSAVKWLMISKSKSLN